MASQVDGDTSEEIGLHDVSMQPGDSQPDEANGTPGMRPTKAVNDGALAAAGPMKAAEMSSVSGAIGEVSSMERGIDRLLQKHRNDIMYELRALRMGERLVTSDNGAREAVEEFFNQGPEPTPSRQERPESVVVEVSALIERRPVSTVLNSQQFRRSLENAIRGSFLNSSRQQSRLSQTSTQPAPSLPVESNTTSRAVHDEAQDRASTVTSRDNRANSTGRAETWLQQLTREEISPGNPTWQHLEEAQRDNLVAEISELVHQQLVTSTLHSEFRGQLEETVMTRVENIPSDGRRVAETIRSLAPTQHHRRNDFSRLGIAPAAPREDSLDNVSVISATAAVAMPFAQSNAALRQEIQSLKTQMTSLQQMMKMSFELQLEMQRSLRQEVAAGLNSHTAQHGTAQAPMPSWSRPANEGQCLICLENHVDSVLCQCGHMCVCQACGLQLREREHNCPVCRAPIRDVVRVYRSNPA